MRRDFFDPNLVTKRITKRFHTLSHREAQVCCLVTRRLNTFEIAQCLSISQRTVEKHLENVFKKLAVRSRERLRLRLGVFPPITDWLLRGDGSHT